MPLNAKKFIRNRGENIISITYDRINLIMNYVVECYNLLSVDKPSYSRAHINDTTTYHFEDYLKMEFVKNYLIKNKHLIAATLSSLEEVTFTYETVKRFIDTDDGICKSDKIDIYVNRLGLKDEWAISEEHLYLAIECKRIKVLSDCKHYIEDTHNFCNREHRELRIPFESQIAFIENPNLTYMSISDEVNSRLKAISTITTKQYLNPIRLNSAFQGSYSSIHKRNFGRKDPFTIFHLLFDYSRLVIP